MKTDNIYMSTDSEYCFPAVQFLLSNILDDKFAFNFI